MTRGRALHRAAGLALALPLLVWAATGVLFHVKPGYGPAYASLAVKTYPLDGAKWPAPAPGWREARFLRTVLGDHLLVVGDDGARHLDPATLAPRPAPTEAEVRLLLADAFAADPGRYGAVAEVSGASARTDTGVAVTLDWATLTLRQRGRDTDLIDRLYRLHYLQWTGVGPADKALGLLGPVLLVLLTALGLRLAFRRE